MNDQDFGNKKSRSDMQTPISDKNGRKRPLIACFLPDLICGGAERVVVNLIRALVHRGISVDLVLTKAIGNLLDEVPAEVRVVDLHTRRMKASIRPLSRYLRSEQPDVLLSALDHTNLCAVLARRLSGARTKLVLAVHSVHKHIAEYDRSWKGRFQRMIGRYLYRWADKIVTVSHGVADSTAELMGIPRSRFHVIYNPVIGQELYDKARAPLDHPWFKPDQPPVVLAVGNLLPWKDFGTLLKAFSLVRAQREARLMILGEGDERRFLEGMIRELGLGEDASLPGFMENPYSYMSRAAVLALSSHWEALPTVLIEALALEVPIVSTDCDFGPREILAHGKYGKLVPVDDVRALASAICSSLSEPRMVVPEEAISAFTVEHATEEYCKILLGGDLA
jgi:glycosyltransferase involved in cell wall biosynthesis